MHKYLHIPAPSLDSFELQLTTRAIKISMRHVKDQKLPITPDLLYKLCTICDGLDCPLARMLKCAFTIAFFGFLRQSNLAPRTPAAFDPTRHTCRGNVIVTPHGLHVVLNWSKTNQHMDSHTIPLPTLQDATVDPRAAYVAMLSDTPTTSRHEPLLQLPAKAGRTTVTVATLAACLNQLLIQAGADHRRYSLHSFRRGGATAASLGGAAATDIQSHGGWRSSAFTDYIRKQPHDTTVIPALTVAAATPRRTASPAAARPATSDIRID
jgi:integrase